MHNFLTSLLMMALCITLANLHGGAAGVNTSEVAFKRNDAPTPVVEGDAQGARETPKPIHEGDPQGAVWDAGDS
ncbi:hypothetical protein SOMG_03903 [Schizosaccharomyces osmophilus]|uniref:Secreted protein n=1 Tax=Schizosaccharomyces osmophilus TaxID=2545709 RepID=A0AAE9WF17_9SCHI|nr:uncharacterized protein SOMG_03903 [Schizosaccharomyces osmophilus]WBW74454.1 hypothetical protein SOMG_03903 [Schizosaccharomyces osmophilus]